MANPTQMDWAPLLQAPFTITKAQVAVPWLLVCEDFAGLTHLRISAQGIWSLLSAAPTKLGPDGGTGPATQTVLTELTHAPFGALVGKIGGASAGCMPATTAVPIGATAPLLPWPPQIDQPFLIGTFCIVEISKTLIGPLYIGFNCVARPLQVSSLVVKVDGAVLTS